MLTVLQHYGLKTDRQHRMCCPFHADKTPSMQVYYKTQTAYCFSANCKTHGKSMDVIDFILYKEEVSKAAAIQKAKELLGNVSKNNLIKSNSAVPAKSKHRIEVLQKIFAYFCNALPYSKAAQTYLEQRRLDYKKIAVGYNAGQFHLGTKKDEAFISECLANGLLIDRAIASRVGTPTYSVFGKNSLVFALKNAAGEITGLYFRSIVIATARETQQEANPSLQAKHFYLKNSTGIYPHYPHPAIKTLIITESIIDAASLLQLDFIYPKYGILAAFGSNRLNLEMQEALSNLVHLEEIIFAFDNDDAGNKAVEKYAQELHEKLPKVSISRLELPNKDINDTLQAHDAEVFIHLLENRKSLFLSHEKLSKKEGNSIEIASFLQKKEENEAQNEENPTQNHFNTDNPYKIIYKTEIATYSILGGLPKQLDMLKIMLQTENTQGLKSRQKVDLYEDKQVEKLCKEVAEKLQIRKDLMENDLYELTDLLENYRENQQENTSSPAETLPKSFFTTQERIELEHFLKQPNVIPRINELLGKTGIVGEERNRIFLLLIAISYKMKEPLHALVQGSSGSGKTKIVRQVSDCIPEECVTRFTRISDKALYNYPKNYFTNRLLIIEDADGLSEEAELAFRELQSSGELRSSVSIKLENGNITSGEKIVSGPIASMSCTTKGEVYEDNMSRVFLIAVDESAEQTKRIIQYQNQKASGKINTKEAKNAIRFIQNIIRITENKEVINPFAEKIHLPEEAHKIRRLNDLFQNFIKIVTLLNQFQRRQTPQKQLIAEIEDIETAIDMIFESIVLKVDELDGSLRQFYEQLKAFILHKSPNYEFNRFEVRAATGLGKTQQHHYLSRLVELEYLQQSGFANRGFRYKIVHWDNYKKLRERIKNNLKEQIEKLKTEHQRTPTERQK